MYKNKKDLGNISKTAALTILIFMSSVFGYTQKPDIILKLKEKDTVTGASVNIYHDLSIATVLVKSSSGEQIHLSKGWCVQVFSDNAVTAKDEAFMIENKIKERMPNEYIRSERHTPFWKVRVGQFETIEEANVLKELILKEFPELKGSIYVVRFNNNN